MMFVETITMYTVVVILTATLSNGQTEKALYRWDVSTAAMPTAQERCRETSFHFVPIMLAKLVQTGKVAEEDKPPPIKGNCIEFPVRPPKPRERPA